MTPEERQRIADALPDHPEMGPEMRTPEGYQYWKDWRARLGHPYATGHGHCLTCGPATTCLLLAFREVLTESILESVDRMGILKPLGGEDCTHGDTWFDRIPCSEPCGSMHTYCSWCGLALEPPCPFPDRYPDVPYSGNAN